MRRSAPAPRDRRRDRSRAGRSRNGRIAFATVQYDKPAQRPRQAAGRAARDGRGIGERAGLEVYRRGQIVDLAEQQTAPVGELIGVAVAVIVLTLVFHSVAAMLLTLFSALLALAGGLCC